MSVLLLGPRQSKKVQGSLQGSLQGSRSNAWDVKSAAGHTMHAKPCMWCHVRFVSVYGKSVDSCMATSGTWILQLGFLLARDCPIVCALRSSGESVSSGGVSSLVSPNVSSLRSLLARNCPIVCALRSRGESVPSGGVSLLDFPLLSSYTTKTWTCTDGKRAKFAYVLYHPQYKNVSMVFFTLVSPLSKG